ncbi:HNH endonuclease [Saccharothrix saharensis]|uniref:HNH endonuclease n=1 Tax=Saccharothrix saharensis TaxID=571190 RepID=A0A543JBD2_9PSEU|nr:HNH endonuclease signature motif containing protein [Saccharothrix saharensis]TQM80130.1 HNH endonuclease [Saccharothrix saharensis]
MPDTAPDRATRLAEAVLRDGDDCTWCRRRFARHVTPTTDHLVPKVKGGPSWLENEVAACRRCNRERGHLSPVDWLTECERRGWHPDRARVTRALESLSRAIADRGGQRRARPYLAAQLRRLTDTAGGRAGGPFKSG